MGIIWFDKPAEKWEQALPIGNGRLGAMVHGGTKQEVLQLNQDSIWYGGPVDRINPDAKANLDEVRKLLLEEKIPEAEQLLRYSFSGTPQSQRPYQTLGKLQLTYLDSEDCKKTPEYYRRELELDNGMVVETSKWEQRRITKEYLASYPHGVIAVHMVAEEGTISLDALLTRGRFYENAGKLDEKTIYMDGTLGKDGVSFLVGVRAESNSGEVRVLGEHLIVREAKDLTLYVSCETSFYEQDWKKVVCERLNKASEAGYEAVKETHVQDYKALYDRVELQLNTDCPVEEGEEADIPIDKRMELGKEKGFGVEYAESYYQYGRYLLISSSRPGSLPANLQGIWNDSMTPSWDSKFTININTEMNYWPAEMCSLWECHLPLFDMLLRMRERGGEVARRMYGCRGFVAHHNTDIWADCAPQDIYIPATYWVMGGAWLSTHIWQHYLYTQDKAFLEKMYPVLRDAVLFFHDYLIELDGQLVTCPSVSPENTYILESGVSGQVCVGPTMDSQILRDLMEGYLKASEILAVEEDMVDKTKEILAKLPPLQVGQHGQIMEWRKDYGERDPGHRHISHLYGLHPSHQITVDKTPELAEAAGKTLERRLQNGGGHTGWSCAWIVNFYTRLGDGERAYDNLQKLWTKSTYPNLMDTHPKKDGFVFQIDGNFGATAAITEMLVQSDEDRVLLLPALPKQWESGRLKGVTLAGGARMDLEWKDGKLTYCKVYSDKSVEVTLVYDNKKYVVALEAGKPYEIKNLI